MRLKVFILSILVLGCGIFSSCALLQNGGASKFESSTSKAEGQVDVSFDHVYDATLETVREMGGISEDRKSEGLINFALDNYKYTIQINKLSDGKIQIAVSAMEFPMPKVHDANDVLTKILERIKQQPLWLK